MKKARAKRQKDPTYLRYLGGKLVPSSAFYERQLAEKWKEGDLIRAELTQPRHPRHHALVMATMQLVLDSQEHLHSIDQLLTIVKIKLGRCQTLIDASTGKVFYVVESIAWDQMDQGEFEVFWKDLSALIARDYFPTMTPDQVRAIGARLDAQ